VVGQLFAITVLGACLRKALNSIDAWQDPLKTTSSTGSQFSRFCLKLCECAKTSMADGTRENQPVSDRVLSCMSACRILLFVVLLQQDEELLKRIAARNHLNCRGSRLHSCISN